MVERKKEETLRTFEKFRHFHFHKISKRGRSRWSKGEGDNKINLHPLRSKFPWGETFGVTISALYEPFTTSILVEGDTF